MDNVAVFYSAKLNLAQQNYPVYEIKMLAGVETMLRHCDILQGVKFRWYTDHKGLIHLLQQKNLSGRQACWMEKISEFDFEVIYIPGSKNILSDVLSQLYSYDEPGTVCARSEYMYHDILDNDGLKLHSVSMPLLVGLEALNISLGDAAQMGTDSGVGDLEGMSVSGPSAPWAHCKVMEPAEMDRPETSHEFAAHVSHSFVLCGLQQHEKGGSTTVPSAAPPTGSTQSSERLIIHIPVCKKQQSALDMEQALNADLTKHADALHDLLEPLPAITLEELVAGGHERIDLLNII